MTPIIGFPHYEPRALKKCLGCGTELMVRREYPAKDFPLPGDGMQPSTQRLPAVPPVKPREQTPIPVLAVKAAPVVVPGLTSLGVIREFAEIEVYGKRSELPPPARMYVIRIDRTKHTIDAAGLSGRQLLELAGKRPAERFAIFLRLCDGRTRVLPHDALIDFMTLGLEQLVTLPLDQTEGTLE